MHSPPLGDGDGGVVCIAVAVPVCDLRREAAHSYGVKRGLEAFRPARSF
jgi:hypothetical protein